MTKNWLKSQTFLLKKNQRQERKCVWEAQNALPKRTLSHQMSLHYTISHMIPKLIEYQIRLYKYLLHGRLLGLTLKV